MLPANANVTQSNSSSNSYAFLCNLHRTEKLYAEKMANITFSVIARSCNKMIIGKTYWKSVVQPRVLSAAAVVV